MGGIAPPGGPCALRSSRRQGVAEKSWRPEAETELGAERPQATLGGIVQKAETLPDPLEA